MPGPGEDALASIEFVLIFCRIFRRSGVETGHPGEIWPLYPVFIGSCPGIFTLNCCFEYVRSSDCKNETGVPAGLSCHRKGAGNARTPILATRVHNECPVKRGKFSRLTPLTSWVSPLPGRTPVSAVSRINTRNLPLGGRPAPASLQILGLLLFARQALFADISDNLPANYNCSLPDRCLEC